MATKKNPYAAGGGHTDAPVTRREVEEPQGPVVPAGNVSEVLEWVGEDQERAQLALDAEKAGHGRKTLLKQLKELLG